MPHKMKVNSGELGAGGGQNISHFRCGKCLHLILCQQDMTSSDSFSHPRPNHPAIFSAYFQRQLPARKHIANYDANGEWAEMLSFPKQPTKKKKFICALMLLLVLAAHGKTEKYRTNRFYSNWKRLQYRSINVEIMKNNSFQLFPS